MGRNAVIRTCGKSAGFTLVEVLAALAILALAASVVVLNAPPGQSPAEEDAEVFAARLQQAVDAALLAGVPIRLEVTAGGYDFLRYEDGAWRRDGTSNSGARNVDTFMRLERGEDDLLRENARILGGPAADENETRIVLIDPIGGVPPFVLRFGAPSAVSVSLDAAGRVKMVKE